MIRRILLVSGRWLGAKQYRARVAAVAVMTLVFGALIVTGHGVWIGCAYVLFAAVQAAAFEAQTKDLGTYLDWQDKEITYLRNNLAWHESGGPEISRRIAENMKRGADDFVDRQAFIAIRSIEKGEFVTSADVDVDLSELGDKEPATLRNA